jgi:hypothetical protein
MTAPRRPSTSRPGWFWLLGLALILALAQTAAALHAYAHVRQDAGGHADGKQAVGFASCDLCVTAAALNVGTLIGKNVVLPFVRRHDALAGESVASVWLAPTLLAYRSQAPPSSRL